MSSFLSSGLNAGAAPQKPGPPAAGDDSEGLGLEYIYLREYFGHEEFRGGQHEVVRAAVAGRDVAVFWATGAGKSLCYQLPALQTGKTVLVISPLISLMMDQVTKFNATVGAGKGNHRACFLGSAQFDPEVEQAAVRGEYRLVYITPEKLTGSFLERLKPLHASKGISLVAVDEAHCISEWGHDFRPAYRELKNIRQGLPGLPLMALTATAIPRVQDDIVEQLGLSKDLLASKSSFDRPNLRLACTRKQTKAADLDRIARGVVAEGGSTIVYTPTQGETDTVAAHLASKLSPNGVKVMAYHGGKAPAEREQAHLDFLSGRARVIVATVAFGMGIDKPDIRRVVHYGPPKTVEEYFQQIGRAGRDGRTSACELVAADSDFAAYSSEFYTRGLTEKAKQQMLASTDALRRFAGHGACRRRWLLEYFGEAPVFGERCGTCDVCVSTPAGAETHRDFRQAAEPVLEALAATQNFTLSMTQVLPICAGTFKPKVGTPYTGAVNAVLPRIRAMREALPRLMRTEAFTKELLGALCNEGFVERTRKTLENTGRSFGNSFDVYALTDKGLAARYQKTEVRLPVPQAVRQQEEEQKLKAAAISKELQQAGLDPKAVPSKEIEDGEGPTLWYIRKLKHWRESGKENLLKMAENHEELRRRILAWRDESAQRLRMSPADVLAEHIVMNITYVKPTCVEALKAVGVRIVGVEALAELVAKAKQELFPQADGATQGDAATQGEGGAESGGAAMLCLPPGAWTPPRPWEHAVYKRGKNAPPWETSHERWAGGETLQAIAMKQQSARGAIQPATVLGHLFTALTFGKPVDLARLFREGEKCPPNEAEWTRMEEAAAERQLQVLSADFTAKDLLTGILGEKVQRDRTEKSEAEVEQEGYWYDKIRIWQALKRCHFPATFAKADGDGAEPAAKRAKLELA